MQNYAANLILLDGTLRDYGPDASAAPPPHHSSLAGPLAEARRHRCGPDTGQRWLQEQALQTTSALLHQRWLMIEQSEPTVQPIILGMVVIWVAAIFASFGLNAPRHATTVTAFIVCALGDRRRRFPDLGVGQYVRGIAARSRPANAQRAGAHGG